MSTVPGTATDFIVCSSTTASMSTCLTDSGTTALLYAEEELADSDNSEVDSDKSTDDEEGNVMVSD
jgi:hypothetical protein